MKAFFRSIHLYLGLAAGLVIIFSAITGAILVFEEEIEHIIHNKRFYVKPSGKILSLDKITETALNAVPKSRLFSVIVHSGQDRTIEVWLIAPKAGDKPGIIAYINPYTGKIAELFNRKESFFTKVEMLHRFILGKKGGVGQWITGISTLFFFFILLTGIILWWPKTKKILFHRLKIKTDGSFKRLNRDLHIVTGFYTSIFLIVIVMTTLR